MSDLRKKVELITKLAGKPVLSDAQLRVAVVLFLHFHNTKTGECFPSLNQLGAAACTKKRTAQRTIEKLKALGVIDFERSTGGRNKRNSYTLKTVSPAHPLEAETVSQAHLFENGNGALGTQKGCARDAETVSPAHPHISREGNTGIVTGNNSAIDFENFWKQYPRKRDKAKARSAYTKARRKASAEEILRGAMAYAAECDGKDPQFIKHPATWLNAEAWENEPEARHPCSSRENEMAEIDRELEEARRRDARRARNGSTAIMRAVRDQIEEAEESDRRKHQKDTR